MVSFLVYIFGLKYIPFAGGFHAYVWKLVEHPQSMSLCPELPEELITGVTFSEGMQRLSALIAMFASGDLRVMRLVVKGAFTLLCTEIPSDFPPSWWIRLTTSRAKNTRLHFPPSRPSFRLCRITQVLVPGVKEGLHSSHYGKRFLTPPNHVPLPLFLCFR